MISKKKNGQPAYPNLYTDISCFEKNDCIHYKVNYFDKADDETKKKILYGSDYYLNMLSVRNMKAYVQNFRSVFSNTSDFDMITSDNPGKFLNFRV